MDSVLTLEIPETTDLWDSANEEFISVPKTTLRLAHSLVSISKWEAHWHKSYFETRDKTSEEAMDYIKCMTIDRNVDPLVYYVLSEKDVAKIEAYLNDPMTATKIYNPTEQTKNREKLTSELIYYLMISYNIPVEFERWHINRLLTLLEVFQVKTTPPKKRSRAELAKYYAELNAKRCKEWGTSG